VLYLKVKRRQGGFRKMQIYGPNELLKDVHERDLCTACGACVDLCPYFKTYRGKTAMIFPCDLEQGRCYAYCPKAEVDLDRLSKDLRGKAYEESALGDYRKVFAAKAGDRMLKGPFQAGGVVSAIMAFALEKDMIDSAVLTDREGLVPVPRIATSAREVAECAGSKYMAAPTVSAVNRGAREGYTRMGVVGTPCQVTALAQMRSNPLGRPDFIDPVALVVGLFCTWALDTRKLISMLSKRLDISGIRKMDIPPPPAEIFVLETDNGRMEIPLDEIRPLVPAGCLVCPDMTSEWADISVGVLEGEPEWNTLVIRSKKGNEIVEKAISEGWLQTREIPEESLAHLNFAASNKRKRSLIKCIEEGLVNTGEEERHSVLRISEGVIRKIIGEQEG
jgi:coenzyme F420 hydrogenase subunit beta